VTIKRYMSKQCQAKLALSERTEIYFSYCTESIANHEFTIKRQVI
jgi:hypothetical protein